MFTRHPTKLQGGLFGVRWTCTQLLQKKQVEGFKIRTERRSKLKKIESWTPIE